MGLSLVAGEFVGVGICRPSTPLDFLFGGPVGSCPLTVELGAGSCAGVGVGGVGLLVVGVRPGSLLELVVGFTAAPCWELGRDIWFGLGVGVVEAICFMGVLSGLAGIVVGVYA